MKNKPSIIIYDSTQEQGNDQLYIQVYLQDPLTMLNPISKFMEHHATWRK